MSENTIAEIRDDLDNYGEGKIVYVESHDGQLFMIDEIRSIDNGPDGVMCVAITIGQRVERGHY